MSRIVFVHGVAQQTKNPDLLETAWLEALNAGLAGIAESGTNDPVDASDVSMAYWARLFNPEGAQGPADVELEDWDAATRRVADELVLEWLKHAAAAEEAELATRGAQALAELQQAESSPGEAQGAPEVVRVGLNLLGRLRFTSRVAFPITAHLMRRSLYQVAAYLSDDDIRRRHPETLPPTATSPP